MGKKRDELTLDLFAMPAPRPENPASMNFRDEVCELIAKISKDADADRYELATRMSRLVGRTVSKNIIDAWSSEAREGHNLPFYMAPVYEVACNSTELTEWLANVRGGQALFGAETLKAELGRIDAIARKADQRRRELIAQLDAVERSR